MLVPNKKLYIEDIKGNALEVRKLSIKDTEEFRLTLLELNQEVESEDYKTLTFATGYATMPMFKHLIDKLLGLCGLDINKLDIDSVFNLMFPHKLEDGSYNRQGLLAKFILGEVTGGSHVPAKEVNHYAKLIGELWASFSDLQQVIDIVSNLDYEMLNEVMRHRNHALKPEEQKQKEEAVEKAKEAMSKMKDVKVGKEVDLGDLI